MAAVEHSATQTKSLMQASVATKAVEDLLLDLGHVDLGHVD
jgi:hypothetical protein